MSTPPSPPVEAAARAWTALGGPPGALPDLQRVVEALSAAGLTFVGASRANLLPRLRFGDAAQQVELGPRELERAADRLRRGEGLDLGALRQSMPEPLVRGPLPELG